MKKKQQFGQISPDQLTSLAQKLSNQFWQKECTIPVIWNGRLSRTMGRFCYTIQRKKRIPLRIELSKKAASTLPPQTFTAVLLHELCHYHLFIQGKPFTDYHPIFEAELKRVGAIPTNTITLPHKGYELYCTACKAYLGKRKRFNTKNYLSSCCHAPVLKKETLI